MIIEKVYDNCCGIDVHKKLIVACLLRGKKQEIREFGATTRALLELADWLKQGDCQMVAMESTKNKFNQERKINAYLKKLKALGWDGSTVAA